MKSKGLNMLYNVCSLTVIGLSIIFFAFGYYGHEQVLSNNKCEMTYSKPSFKKISMTSKVSKYGLYMDDSDKKKGDLLNPLPVLFIPGNNGNIMQGRSIASSMHNDGTFQHFVIDFANTRSALHGSALHGSVVLSQAVFVNDAIAKILDMYAVKKQKVPNHVILVAHSAGGMVARTAVLLDNHPQCAVNSIIMLSSPNSSPAYSPDVTLEKVYTAVNRAWKLSLYNQSKACQNHNSATEFDDNLNPLRNSNISFTQVNANWDCAPCIPDIRLVSISGGEVDNQVSPITSHLNVISPIPYNHSAPPQVPQSIGTMLKPKGGFVRYFMSKLYYAFSSLYSDTSNNAKVNDTNVSAYCNSSENTNETGICNDSNISVKNNEDKPIQSVKDITIKHWEKHMSLYVEPLHISLRTVQLSQIGFPVDHLAMLWCSQVLKVTVDLMKLLSRTDVELTPLNFESHLKLKSEFVSDQSSLREYIPPIMSHYHRNATLKMYTRDASNYERTIFYDILNSNILLTMSFVFYTNYIETILTCFILVSVLVIATYILHELGGSNKYNAFNSFEMLLPHNHIFLGIYENLMAVLVPKSLMSFINKHYLNNMYKKIFYSIITGFLIYRYLIGSSLHNPLEFYQRFGKCFQWTVSYGVAVFMHMVILLIVKLIRSVIKLILSIISMILKYTIWCSYIRKPVKSILKPFISFVKKNILVLTVPQFFGVLLLAMTLTSVYMSKERFNEDNSNSNIVIEKISFCTCMIYLYSFGFFVVMLISSILYQQQYSSKYVEFMHGIFIVGLVLSIPSLQYAIMIVRSPISEFGAALPLFKVFDPELVNYCVTLLLFGFHLLDMQRNEREIKPVAWISELFAYSRKFLNQKEVPNVDFMSHANISSDGVCKHEDGGLYAIFQRNSEGVKSLSNGAVLDGPAFLVISCNCSLDKSLKNSIEWCEWCKCPKCGGKFLPKQDNDKFDSFKLPDISADLGLFVGLIFAAAWTIVYAAGLPYRNIFIIGLVSASFLLSKLLKTFGL